MVKLGRCVEHGVVKVGESVFGEASADVEAESLGGRLGGSVGVSAGFARLPFFATFGEEPPP